MSDLVVYGSPLSPFVRKVEVLLREKGLEFESENVNVIGMPDWFAEISPARRIPVLRDRSIGAEGVAGTIPDSSAICAFLERKAPEPAFYPDDAYTLGRALWFEEYADAELAGLTGAGIFRPLMFPRFQGKDSDVDTARATFNEKLPPKLDYLEQSLDGRDYLHGDGPTIGDVAVVCVLSQIDVVAGMPDPKRWPAVAALYKRISERPSMATNLATCAKMLARALPEKFDLS
ncbi:MAG: glutathione S-transferase family protein [Gammaproteobacteria bacterium]|nr:MAG: glutathione S-transferase family protein [Gammaproteobacteria bacterium]